MATGEHSNHRQRPLRAVPDLGIARRIPNYNHEDSITTPDRQRVSLTPRGRLIRNLALVALAPASLLGLNVLATKDLQKRQVADLKQALTMHTGDLILGKGTHLRSEARMDPNKTETTVVDTVQEGQVVVFHEAVEFTDSGDTWVGAMRGGNSTSLNDRASRTVWVNLTELRQPENIGHVLSRGLDDVTDITTGPDGQIHTNSGAIVQGAATASQMSATSLHLTTASSATREF